MMIMAVVVVIVVVVVVVVVIVVVVVCNAMHMKKVRNIESRKVIVWKEILVGKSIYNRDHACRCAARVCGVLST